MLQGQFWHPLHSLPKLQRLAGKAVRLAHIPWPGCTTHCPMELPCAVLCQLEAEVGQTPPRAGDPPGTNWEPPTLCQPQAHVCRYTLVASICYDTFLQALSFPRSAKNMSFSFCTTAPRWLGSLEGFHVCLCGLSRQKGWDFSRPGMFLFCSAVFWWFFFLHGPCKVSRSS